MGFDFFKKKDTKRRKDAGDDSAFSEDLEFDDIETSGEFLSGPEGQYPPTPPPAPPPPARQARPGNPAYPPPPSPPAYPPPPSAPANPPARNPVDDDITMVNRPPVIPRGPVSPPTGAVPPPGPRQPVPPRAPVAPQAPVAPGPPAYPSPPAGPPPVVPPPPNVPSGLTEDEVTQVLNKPVSSEAVVAWLVVAEGPLRGEDFRLPSGTARLGQHPQCEIRITGDTFISTQHAEFRFQGGTYWVHDLGSTNGLFLNGSRITQGALADGDQIKAGTTLMVFKSVKI